MELNPSNGSDLEQLALKGLINYQLSNHADVTPCRFVIISESSF